MAEVVLRMTTPQQVLVPADSGESRLRQVYAHEPGTVRLGLIASADGKASGPDGSSRSLNGPEDLRILRTLRSLADVVVVGGRTARNEHYTDIRLPGALADAREHAGQPGAPDLAIVTFRGAIPDGLDPERTWIVTTAGSPASQVAEGAWRERIIEAGSTYLDARLAVVGLHERGLAAVLCEGGPELARAMLEGGVVHDYCLTHSPHLGGEDAASVPAVPAHMELAHRLDGAGFVMERWVS
jgi:5-amino-6-(5-phosphoribosylamino)uracil reductase